MIDDERHRQLRSLSFDWTSAVKEASLADIGGGRAMDDDHRELTNRLFATATAMVEDVTGIAVAGQSSRLEPSQLAGIARQFKAAAHDITTIAEAAAIVAALERQAPETGAKSRC